jgi:hypothetical protein
MALRPFLLLALGASLAACGTNDPLPPPNSARCNTTCDASFALGGGGGGGGTPGLDAGAPAEAGMDATAEAPSTTVTGTLRLFRDLPPGMSVPMSVGGWTIRTLPLFDADAGTPVELSTLSGPLGDYTLPGIPMRQTLPGETTTGHWLLATSPAAGRISTLFTVRTASDLALETVTDDTVRTILSASGLVQADDRAMIAVFVRQSTVRDALPVRGVRVEADGQASATLYDSVAGMEISETGTGRLGFALLPNVPVPASGDGFVAVSADRAARPYVVRVRRATLSWMLVVSI